MQKTELDAMRFALAGSILQLTTPMPTYLGESITCIKTLAHFSQSVDLAPAEKSLTWSFSWHLMKHPSLLAQSSQQMVE
jgi:hypothetical protein